MYHHFYLIFLFRKYNRNEHDDRASDGGHGGPGGSSNKVWSRLGSRQVSFGDDGAGAPGIRNKGGIFKKGRGRFQNQKIHVIVPTEDDEGMGGDGDGRGGEQAGRGRPLPRMRGGGDRGRYKYSRRGGPGRTPPGIVVGHRASSIFSWQKVVLKNGSKYDKMMLLKELLNRSNTKFIPICYTKSGNNTFFYLEDQTAAKALKDLDKKIELPDGFQLQISIQQSSPPNMPLTDELVDKVKHVMSSRYNINYFIQKSSNYFVPGTQSTPKP